MSDINYNQKFWKNAKSIFGNKNKGNNTIEIILYYSPGRRK